MNVRKAIYLQRMKIEECFRDIKNLLGLDRLMNKRRDHMEKRVAWLIIAYAIGLWLGKVLRVDMFPNHIRKYKLFSGLFVFLKLKPPPNFIQYSLLALASFSTLVLNVRTFV